MTPVTGAAKEEAVNEEVAGSAGGSGVPSAGADGVPAGPDGPDNLNDGADGADGAGAGLGARVDAALGVLASVVSDLDPARLTGSDATRLYSSLVGLERLTNAGKTLLAPRIEESGVWRSEGHRTAAVMLASLEGVATGQAQSILANGRRLDQLPGTEAALRAGALSGPKVTELTGAGILAPEREASLLSGAELAPLQAVRDRCRRSRATSGPDDPKARVRRIREARHFSSWTDAEGAFCYQGRDTLDRGAQLLSRLGSVATGLRRARRAAGDDHRDPERAVRADALFALVTRGHPDSGGRDTDADTEAGPTTDTDPDDDGRPPPDPGSLIDRPPTCSVMVRVDLEALVRGYTEGDECCEIDHQGPIPVAMARDMANDSFLSLVFHRAGDIRAVSHLGRTINRPLRTALVHRDTTCVVPGCGTSFGLEIDHLVPFAEGGPTELDNLALLCHHHHFLKTYEDWVLSRDGTGRDGTPRWRFEPPPPFGQEPGLGLDTDEARSQRARDRRDE